jgi:hypothetical protein
LYDYPLDGDTLQVDDEEIKLLKFKKGDIISVYEQDPSGWYVGARNFISVPFSYLIIIINVNHRWAGEFNDEKVIS